MSYLIKLVQFFGGPCPPSPQPASSQMLASWPIRVCSLKVFDIVYRQELVPSAMLEKMKPVLDASYEPYISDGKQEDDKDPEFFRTDEG
ncbi:hypothetical protein DSO57_1013899 [Entomophthora muscae]|uniref:Uncharacterized protein n=1 Tax=Entomophthora muscae TaxID=34485 RepID=A0ACC2TGD0_9FUNG|nr:hypothetical protein DSO57_1013899 [Entomophthora muscae]